MSPLTGGTSIDGITLRSDVPQAHKVALRPIRKGEAVTKYGYPIGYASRDIAIGEHVHSQNVESGLRENLAQAGYAQGTVRREAIAAAGRMVAELPALWFRPHESVVALVKEVHGLEPALEARAQGRPVVFLTPHMGCFEVAAQYAAARMPITVLYRPPKIGWLDPLMREGRARPNVRLVPADVTGVRAVLGPSVVAWIEDTAYGLADRINVWRHGDEAPTTFWEAPAGASAALSAAPAPEVVPAKVDVADASAPEAAVRTSQSWLRMARSDSRTPSSSSTTRIFGLFVIARA